MVVMMKRMENDREFEKVCIFSMSSDMKRIMAHVSRLYHFVF